MLRKILIPTDGYGLEDHVITYVARAFPFAEFHMISVVNTYERGVQLTNLLYDEMKKAAENAVLEAEQKLGALGITDVKIAVLEGLPSREILRYAIAHDIDIIAMRVYSRKHTASAHRLGSTVKNVLKKSRVPVLTVADECNKLPIKNLILLTDGTAKTKMAENFAILFASSYNVSIEAMYFSLKEREKQHGESILKNLEWKAEHWGVKIKKNVVEDSIDGMMKHLSSGDIVVMGIGKRTLFGYKIGHVALYIGTHSPIPVIFVHKGNSKRWFSRMPRR